MKVLISYTTDGQIAIIKGLVESLAERGIDVLAWNRTTHRCFSNNEDAFKSNISFLSGLKRFPRVIMMLLYHLPLFLSYFTKRGLYNIDVLNFHFHEGLCDRLIPCIRENDTKLIISIWGSDLYRISDKTKEKRQKVYPQVDLIHVESPGVKKDFLNTYRVDERRVVSCNFGVYLFENINRLRNDKDSIIEKMLPKEAKDKIIVTCGYNARKGQQHAIMIEQLKSLPEEYKKRLFVVFPLTYTVSYDSFLDEIEDELKDFDIPYYCFREKLGVDDLAKLRILSDVVINIQISDALSSSLVEYFYAGNIMLLGDWLPYEFLKEEYDIHYIPIRINNVAEKIQSVIDNFDKETLLARDNITKTYVLASWESVSSRFVKMFTDVYNKRKQ